MARRGTVKLSIESTYDSRGTDRANRALKKFEENVNTTGSVQAKRLAESSIQLDQQATKWSKLGDDIQNVGRKMSGAGDTLTKGLTLPIVAAGTAMVNTSINFESAFAGVRKTVDATEEQFEALRTGIRDMALELPATREEIAGVAEAAGQLGIETDSILGFTRVMIDLGESTDLSANDAATALAQLANITGMSQDDFDKLGSSIVALGNNMATTESRIVEMGLNIAGAGAQVGMSEDQMLALAAALSSVGIEAEAGGSAISRTMIEIERQVQTSGDDLEKWAQIAGMSASDFAAAWEDDAATALMTFIAGLSNMESQGSSAIEALDDLGITEIRQRDALLRAAGASDLMSDALGISAAAWEENTALAKEAEQRYATTESQMAILKNTVTDIALEFGDALAPALMDAVEAARPALDWAKRQAEAFSDLDEEQQQNILKWAAIAAAIGPVLSISGRLVTVVGGMVKTLGAATGALASFRAAQAAAAASGQSLWTAVDGTGKALGALKVVGAVGAISLLAQTWQEAAPAARDYAKAVREGTEEAPTAGEMMAAPISSLAYIWENATQMAYEYNRTGQSTFEAIDILTNPISSLAYGIGVMSGNTESAADAADRLARASQFEADAIYEAADAALASQDAELALERAKLRLSDAQARYADVMANYPADSREARDAALDLKDAELGVETATRRVETAQKDLAKAQKNLPRPSSPKEWVAYYQAIGDKAGYAAAKANLANETLAGGRGGRTRQIPVYGAGGYIDQPHVAIVGDEPEWIINPKAPNAMDLVGGLLRDMGMSGGLATAPVTSTVSNSRSVVISPGAVQINAGRGGASSASIAAEVEAVLRRIVRNSQLIGV